MEIEIPDLQDLQFEERCQCVNKVWRANQAKQAEQWRKEMAEHQKATGKYAHPSCTRCAGEGFVPTPVGQRLLNFLAQRGMDLKKENEK